MKKNDIRMMVAAHKSLLNDTEKADAAIRLFERLEQLAAFTLADNILVYHSLPDEMPTHTFIEKWSSRKRFFLPRVNGVNLEVLPYDRSRLHLGAFHIEEPDGDNIFPIEDIELVIVPGVAYDGAGHRIGRGKGYYDRLLASSKAVKIGIAYDFQFVDEIEVESTDVDMDFILTDKRCICVRHR